MKNYANAVMREHGGIVFDVGDGRTVSVFHPDGIRDGETAQDEVLAETLKYSQPKVIIREDGTTRVEPGEWRDQKNLRVRYDTDPTTVDRRSTVAFEMPDGTIGLSYDRKLPAGARRVRPIVR